MFDDQQEPLPAPAVAVSATEPVPVTPEPQEAAPTSGTALCLSGGGYRAMLFHVGVLWRLNEAGCCRAQPGVERLGWVDYRRCTRPQLGAPGLRPSGRGARVGDQVVDPIRRFAGLAST